MSPEASPDAGLEHGAAWNGRPRNDMAGEAAPRLRGGPNGLPRARVRTIQRGRLLAAAVDAVGEVGYARMTVAQVIARARVSRRTFYDIFADREDCFLAAFDGALSEATLQAREAYEHEPSWREGIRSALWRLLTLMDQEPRLAELVIVESLAAGDRVLRRRAQLLSELAEIIDEGRSPTNSADEPPQLTAEGVVGAVSAVLYTRLLEGRQRPFTELLGPLMSVIVLPYIGAKDARRELNRRTRPSHSVRRLHEPAGREDLPNGFRMRLTYRTVRVLTTIAEHPGASNREVAQGSGIADQGQISRLLTRLAALNLIENTREGSGKSASNSWWLTELGTQLERLAGQRDHTTAG